MEFDAVTCHEVMAFKFTGRGNLPLSIDTCPNDQGLAIDDDFPGVGRLSHRLFRHTRSRPEITRPDGTVFKGASHVIPNEILALHVSCIPEIASLDGRKGRIDQLHSGCGGDEHVGVVEEKTILTVPKTIESGASLALQQCGGGVHLLDEEGLLHRPCIGSAAHQIPNAGRRGDTDDVGRLPDRLQVVGPVPLIVHPAPAFPGRLDEHATNGLSTRILEIQHILPLMLGIRRVDKPVTLKVPDEHIEIAFKPTAALHSKIREGVFTAGLDRFGGCFNQCNNGMRLRVRITLFLTRSGRKCRQKQSGRQDSGKRHSRTHHVLLRPSGRSSLS